MNQGERHLCLVHRTISQPKNVKLLYDVLQYDPPAIKRAVLYATNNALVCETADDASRVAYDLGDNKRYDVSTVDRRNLQPDLALFCARTLSL